VAVGAAQRAGRCLHRTAQAHGYGGLNFRDIGSAVGIEAASIYHHFPSKADLGAVVAKRYRFEVANHPPLTAEPLMMS
jgi:TetR/AcrR family transcriptional regulator, transcriptional repressor for nem operon